MVRYDVIDSDQQHEAITNAQLVDGLTAREAVEKAVAGEQQAQLPDRQAGA